jgi:hypothetical protein
MYKTPKLEQPHHIGTSGSKPLNLDRRFTFEVGRHATLLLTGSKKQVRVRITNVLDKNRFEGAIVDLDGYADPLEGLELGDIISFEYANIALIE